MPGSHCGHFSLDIEQIYVQGVPVIVRLPIRRCRLAEHMVSVIATTQAGREVARKLTISTTTLDNVGGEVYMIPTGDDLPMDSTIRVAFGPDLEAIHGVECTPERCRESCTPCYKMLLAQFGFEEQAEQETGSGCFELSAESNEAATA